MPRTALAFLIATAFLLATSSVGATRNFPPAIERDLASNYQPDCSICHAGGVTGRGTVTTPFGTAMRARGLVENDTTSLQNALNAMAQDHVDSVGDGVTDIDRLKAGKDPNGTGGDYVPPIYGCGVGVMTRTHDGRCTPVFGMLAVCIASVAFRRRRRGTRR